MPEIRPARAGELALLPAIEAASDSLLSGRPEIRPGNSLPEPAPGEELAAARHVLVAGTPPVAFARLEEVDGCAHLEQLSVHPRAARRGLGRALVEAAIEWSRMQGYPALTLCTFARVPFNAPFYRSCGFEVVEPAGELARIRRREAELGLDGLGERVAMRLELDGPQLGSAPAGI